MSFTTGSFTTASLMTCILTMSLSIGVWSCVPSVVQASETAETGESTDGIPGRTVGGGTRLSLD